MKKKKEAGLDFIGGLGSLTVEEEKALNEFFKQRKLISKKPILRQQHRSAKRTKVTV